MRFHYHTFLKATCLFLCTILFPAMVVAQSGKVTGVVSETETGDYLPGTTVLIKGTSIGTATDVDGRYLLTNVPSGDQTLVFSSVGYNTQEVPVRFRIGGACGST